MKINWILNLSINANHHKIFKKYNQSYDKHFQVVRCKGIIVKN